jgi:hypothetical protein
MPAREPAEPVMQDVQQKIDYLAGQPTPQAVFRHLWKRNAPANKSQLAESEFGIAPHINGWYLARVPSDRVDQLAQWYGFTPALRKAFETQVHSAFRNAYETEYGGTAIASPALSPPAPRQTGVMLTERHDGNNPWQESDLLASLELFTVQKVAGESQLRASLICRSAPFPIDQIAIKQGVLRLRFGENAGAGNAKFSDIAERAADRKWPDIANDTGQAVTIQRAGTSGARTFKVTVDEGNLGEVNFPEDFWRLTLLAPGDTVEAMLRVPIKDFTSTGEISKWLELPPEEQLSAAKERILARLQRTRFPADSDGWVDLCGDALRFQADDPNQRPKTYDKVS